MELGRSGRTLMMMLLLRPPAAQRATGLRQQPDRNRTDNGDNVLATAVANKLARIAWTVLVQGRSYETRVIVEAA